MRHVPRFELPDLVVAQRDLLGRERVLDVPEFRRADDRRGDVGDDRVVGDPDTMMIPPEVLILSFCPSAPTIFGMLGP